MGGPLGRTQSCSSQVPAPKIHAWQLELWRGPPLSPLDSLGPGLRCQNAEMVFQHYEQNKKEPALVPFSVFLQTGSTASSLLPYNPGHLPIAIRIWLVGLSPGRRSERTGTTRCVVQRPGGDPVTECSTKVWAAVVTGERVFDRFLVPLR